VSVKRGSPRYLMWGMPRTGHPPPQPMGPAARLLFCLEACPAFVRQAARLGSQPKVDMELKARLCQETTQYRELNI
jgi:hypothetical protein